MTVETQNDVIANEELFVFLENDGEHRWLPFLGIAVLVACYRKNSKAGADGSFDVSTVE
ncbi:hypothetical protein [Nitrincola sp.]|uniref:hypothetical protein n=1 Tax=Nitrincola sp. TaxID=1926584 RepID=UPI003A8DC8D2